MRPAARAGLGWALALLLTPGPVMGQLYRWSDAQGTVHYTTDPSSIPPEHRAQARDIGAPTPGPLPESPPAGPGLEVPYTGGPLVVDASLNGVPLRMLVDTGADRTLIAPAAMARAGFPPGVGTPVRIRGVTGDAAALLVRVERLDLAGTRVGPVGVVVHALASADGVDGLLGRDVLDAFTLTVDAGTGRARLAPR